MTNNLQELALLSYAALNHPYEKTKSNLKNVLYKYTEPKTIEQIKIILDNEKGTQLEPLSLDKETIEYGALLGGLAFGILGLQTRFYIKEKGGLVITNNLKSYYTDSYIKTSSGKIAKTPKKAWGFNPSNLYRFKGTYQGKRQKPPLCNLVSEEEGFYIRVDEISRWHLTYEYRSRIEGIDKNLKEIGLTIREEKNNGTIIRSGSPESMIKLLAYMAESRTLNLIPNENRHTTEDLPIIRIKLQPPSGEITELKTVVNIPSKHIDWLTGYADPSKIIDIMHEVSKEDLSSISNWMGPHKNWINKIDL